MTSLAPILQGFFTETLSQRHTSAPRITLYRGTFHLLQQHAQRELGKTPSTLEITDLDDAFVGRFLQHLEKQRGEAVTTRDARLAAIHALFHYAAPRCPEHAVLIQRVLAVPTAPRTTSYVPYLTRQESEALLAAPDRTTVLGHRDHLILLVAVQTGLRVSELTALKCADAELGAAAQLRCTGKGGKQRVPLAKTTALLLQAWIADRGAAPTDPLFPAHAGGRLGRDEVAKLLAKYVKIATATCPTLKQKTVTARTLRHTAARELLTASAGASAVALRLGHVSTNATAVYLHADTKRE